MLFRSSSKPVNLHAMSAYQSEKKKAHQEKAAGNNARKCYNCGSPDHSAGKCEKTLDYKKMYLAQNPSFQQSSRGGQGGRGNNRGRGQGRGGNKATNRIVVISAAGKKIPTIEVTLSQDKCEKSEVVSALADTGAEMSIISADIVKRNGFHIGKSRCSLAMADESTQMSCLGVTNMNVLVQDKELKVRALVTDSVRGRLYLGFEDQERFGMLPPGYPTIIRSVEIGRAHV